MGGLADDNSDVDTNKKLVLQVGADQSTNDQLDVHFGKFTIDLTNGASTNVNWGGIGAVDDGVDFVDGNTDSTAYKLNLGNQADAQSTIDALDVMIEQAGSARE